jgi:hypothetical protein
MPSKSLRAAKYCTEVIPRNLMCSGCIQYYDDAPTTYKKTGPRSVTHVGDEFKCAKPWSKILDDSTKRGSWDIGNGNSRLEKIRKYLAAQGYSRLKAATDTSMEATTNTAIEVTDEDMSQLTASVTTGDNSIEDDIVVEVDRRLLPKELENIAVYSDTITSGGHEFVIEGIPITHVVATKSYLKRLIMQSDL